MYTHTSIETWQTKQKTRDLHLESSILLSTEILSMSDSHPKVSSTSAGRNLYYWVGTIGGNFPADGGRTAKSSTSLIRPRSRMISSCCNSMTLIFSMRSRSSMAFLLVEVICCKVSVAWSLLLLRCRPKAASRSWTCVRAIFNSRRRSLISLIKDTFSCNSSNQEIITIHAQGLHNSKHKHWLKNCNDNSQRIKLSLPAI